jgi:hypothetical protein
MQKARKVKEEKETKAVFTSLHPWKKRRLACSYPVEDIGDVYLGEDESIECLVQQKPLRVVMDNLVGGGAALKKRAAV